MSASGTGLPRRSPGHCAAYEQLKHELATRDWRDMNEYADAKGGLIGEILAERSSTIVEFLANPDSPRSGAR